MKNHIIICGLGHIGFRTFELLVKMHEKITIISDKTNEEWRWQVEQAGCVLLHGDARNDELLIKAGIENAKCILALTDQDLVNVSIVMDARKLNPTIRIICRMFDTNLGQHIAEAFHVHQVFSTSELAAPMFSSSIHNDSALAQFTIDNLTYVVSEKNISLPPVESRDAFFILTKEDNIALIATPVDRLNKSIEKVSSAKKYWLELITRIKHFRSPILHNFRLMLGVIFCVILFSALFLEWQMNLSFVDALYFVTTTISTVGYGDFNFSHSSIPLKLFGCLLMLTGAASLTILFSTITEIILSQKLANLFGSVNVPEKNHVVVVGAEHIGMRVISDLLEHHVPIALVESDNNRAICHGFKASSFRCEWKFKKQ